MTGATIVGELTADRQTVILIADGPEYAVADAAKRLSTLTPLVKPTDPAGALRLPASWPAVVQLAQTYGSSWRPGPALAAWIGEQLDARTDHGDELLVDPPAGLVPRSYQVAGARMIGSTGSALIFDDPGSGKTVTAVLGLVERAQLADVLPVVVICPAAVVDSWVDHFTRWAPGWRAIAYRGTPKRRERLAGCFDVYVTSYETARRDADPGEPKAPLRVMRPVSVIADEVHKIKNHQTVQSKAVRRLAGKAANFVGLSGTPITHSPADLWPALDSLSPDAWPSRERWVGRYCDTMPSDYGESIVGLTDAREPEFRTTLLGQHRRVAKADVLTELPPKVYSVRSVELPAAARTAYNAMERDMIAELDDGVELTAMSVLAQLTRLAQLASSSADVTVTTETVDDPVSGFPVEKQHQHVTLRAPSWKVDALLDVMAERPGEAVVAFAPSKQLVQLAGQAAADAGYRVGYIMGGQTARDRTATVEAFQAGKLDLCAVTTGAGGVGLTLTAARTAVFLQRPWSLVEALQAEDRLHRIGAEGHESVEIVDVVARKTIDTRVRSVLRQRAGALSKLVEDPRIVAELLGGGRTGSGEQSTDVVIEAGPIRTASDPDPTAAADSTVRDPATADAVAAAVDELAGAANDADDPISSEGVAA